MYLNGYYVKMSNDRLPNAKKSNGIMSENNLSRRQNIEMSNFDNKTWNHVNDSK
jgi:hypothetical protein